MTKNLAAVFNIEKSVGVTLVVALGRHPALRDPYRKGGRRIATSFGKVVGQERAAAMLSRAVENDKVARVYIVGPAKASVGLTLLLSLSD